MLKSLPGKVAVVTGGAGGIGCAIARACLDADMNVVIADISQEALDRAASELDRPEQVLTVACDISSLSGNEKLAAAALQRFGQVNLVCLNAGAARLKPVQDTREDEWRLQVAVNLDGPFFGVKAFMPLLELQEEAHLVVTASVMSLFAAPVMGPYFATKAAVLTLTESLYFDLQNAGSHVTVSALMPGDTRTDAMKNSIQADTDPAIREMAENDLSEATPPNVVAEAVLASAQSGEFYVLPNIGGYQELIDARHQRIKQRLMPDAEVSAD